MKIKFLEKLKAYFNKDKSQSELTVKQDASENKSYFIGGGGSGSPKMDTIKPGSTPDLDVEKISEKLVEVNQTKETDQSELSTEYKPKPKKKYYRPKKSKSSTDSSVSNNPNSKPTPKKQRVKKNGNE